MGLAVFEKLIDCKPYIFGDLPQQDWRNITTLVERNRGATACTIAELFVRTTLPDFSETEFYKNRNDLGGFENRDIAHV